MRGGRWAKVTSPLFGWRWFHLPATAVERADEDWRDTGAAIYDAERALEWAGLAFHDQVQLYAKRDVLQGGLEEAAELMAGVAKHGTEHMVAEFHKARKARAGRKPWACAGRT